MPKPLAPHADHIIGKILRRLDRRADAAEHDGEDARVGLDGAQVGQIGYRPPASASAAPSE